MVIAGFLFSLPQARACTTSLIQSTTTFGSGATTLTAKFASTVDSPSDKNHAIIVTGRYTIATTTPAAILLMNASDTASDTFSSVPSGSSFPFISNGALSLVQYMFLATGVTSNVSDTVRFNVGTGNASNRIELGIYEVGCVATTSAVDAVATSTNTTATTSIATPSITTASSGDYLGVSVGVGLAVTAFTAGGSWTRESPANGFGSNGRASYEDQVNVNAGTYNPSISWTTAETWLDIIFGLRPPPTPAASSPPPAPYCMVVESDW